MAKVDADISYLLNLIIVSIIILIVVFHFIFGLTVKKLESLILRRVCALIHEKYLDKNKQLLFEQLSDLKQGTKGPFSLLEIGVGGGENFKFYPKGTCFSCVDPNHHHDSDWMKNLKNYKHVQLVESFHAYAEDMPDVKSNSYDVVVSTLTLCTVKDPHAVLREIIRVLKPGGTFFSMEHVAGKKGSMTRLIQEFVMKFTPYSCLSGGCCLNRETWKYLDQANFRTAQYRLYSINSWILFFLRPFLYGTAVKGS